MSEIHVLIIEDDNITLKFMTRHLTNIGYKVTGAMDGIEGVEAFERERPDIVLTDFNLPGQDGLAVVQSIRDLEEDHWTPIIVISAHSEEQKALHCLQAGAEDFINKPVNLRVLEAKLSTFARMTLLQRETTVAKERLGAALDELSMEHELARDLLTSILEQSNHSDSHIDLRIQAADGFSGDLVTVARGNSLNTFILVADSTGHGLRAALPTIVISHEFSKLVSEGASMSKILDTLNTTLYDLLPMQHFVAAALFKINQRHKIIECWNGGLPTAYVVDGNSKLLYEFKSQNMAMGVMSPKTFSNETEMIMVDDVATLFVSTDGLMEAKGETSKFYGLKRIVSTLEATPPGANYCQAILDDLNEFTAGADFEDDVTVISVRVDGEYDS